MCSRYKAIIKKKVSLIKKIRENVYETTLERSAQYQGALGIGNADTTELARGSVWKIALMQSNDKVDILQKIVDINFFEIGGFAFTAVPVYVYINQMNGRANTVETKFVGSAILATRLNKVHQVLAHRHSVTRIGTKGIMSIMSPEDHMDLMKLLKR